MWKPVLTLMTLLCFVWMCNVLVRVREALIIFNVTPHCSGVKTFQCRCVRVRQCEPTVLEGNCHLLLSQSDELECERDSTFSLSLSRLSRLFSDTPLAAVRLHTSRLSLLRPLYLPWAEMLLYFLFSPLPQVALVVSAVTTATVAREGGR